MKEFKLSHKALVMVQGSSKGIQPKYYEDGYWYKVNNVGYESIAERLASIVLKHSNVKEYVEYSECMINGRRGCVSKNFLKDNESFISFQRLYELYTGENLQDAIRTIGTVEGRIDMVCDFIYEHTGLEVKDYLSKILTLDMLILNTDRHFNNLGIVVNDKTSEYYIAPIFDNGNSLLSDWERFSEDSLEENIELVYGMPFSANLYSQAKAVGFGLELNYNELLKELEKEPNNRAVETLKIQLNKYRSVIKDIGEPVKQDIKNKNYDEYKR